MLTALSRRYERPFVATAGVDGGTAASAHRGPTISPPRFARPPVGVTNPLRVIAVVVVLAALVVVDARSGRRDPADERPNGRRRRRSSATRFVLDCGRIHFDWPVEATPVSRAQA